MNTAPAAKRANSVSCKDMSPTATVHKSLFFNKSFGKMKSLHGHANCVSNVYTKIGLDNGTVIVQENAHIACAVDACRFVDGFWNGIEKALLHQVTHRCAAGINQCQTDVTVDEVELRHKKVHSRHSHERGEHSQHQRPFHQGASALKLEGRNGIGCYNHQETFPKDCLSRQPTGCFQTNSCSRSRCR